jgi:CelD/BcsL family acetyltransferase involved in cellulose biosynthesis
MYLDIAMDVEHESWKGPARSSLRANHRLQSFFRQFLLRSCEERKVRFYFLKIGENVAAMQIAIDTNGSCWVLKQGYRESLARFSPGILLSHMAIRSCLERGLSTYEFLGSEENWQSTWPIQRRQYQTILAIPYSIAGAIELIAAISSRVRRK